VDQSSFRWYAESRGSSLGTEGGSVAASLLSTWPNLHRFTGKARPSFIPTAASTPPQIVGIMARLTSHGLCSLISYCLGMRDFSMFEQVLGNVVRIGPIT